MKRGDTLASIARLFKTTVASLKTWNPRFPATQLTAGQRLTVYRSPNLAETEGCGFDALRPPSL